MNLDRIKQIVNSGHPMWDSILIQELAMQEDVIPRILDILNEERRQKNEVYSEMNLLLSQAETGLETPKLNKDGFIGKKIIDFYKKYKGIKGVFHCFCNDIDKK